MNWNYQKKKDKFGRVDEHWSKGKYDIVLHKTRTYWLLTVWREGGDAAEMKFRTKKEALTEIMFIKNDIRGFFKGVDA